jgi:hypothetical protein
MKYGFIGREHPAHRVEHVAGELLVISPNP